MTPLYQTGAFDYPTAMAIAVVLGIGFGFVLERSGFGRAGVMVAQFYGDDMRVLKVMFSAIVTTSVGLGVLGQLGITDLSLISIPKSWMVPQALGGLLLGAGFVISGYCPGTALVSIGSGYKDGLMALVGIMVGSLIFGFSYDALEGLYKSTEMGTFTFTEQLGVAWPILAVAVTVMAVGAFLAGEKVEKFFAKKHGREVLFHEAGTRNGVFVGLGLMAAVGLATLALPGQTVEAAKAPSLSEIDSVELARRIARNSQELYVVDLRSNEACVKARVRGAMCLTAEDPQANFIAELTPTRTLVVYGDSSEVQIPVSVAKYAGPKVALAGGYAAFESTILTQPKPPTKVTRDAVERYKTLSALHQHFTGSQAVAAPIVAKPVKIKKKVRKGGGC